MAKIYGNGLMLIPGRGTFIPFKEGVIVTDDQLIIDAAKLNKFRIVEEQPELDLTVSNQKKEPVRRTRKARA